MSIKELIERRDKVASDMQAMLKTAEEEDRGFSSDEQEQWSQMVDAVDELDARIEAHRAAERPDYSGLIDDVPVNRLNEGDRSAAPEPGSEVATAEQRHAAAFGRLLRSNEQGLQGLSEEDRRAIRDFDRERRAQGTVPDSAGGYLAPDEFGDRLISTLQDFGGIINVANVFQTANGNRLPWPTNDDTANKGAIIGENVEDTEQDMVFGEKALGSFTYTSRIIRISTELLQDSALDIEQIVADAFGVRLGRGTAEHYAVGAGTTEPLGLFTEAASGFTAAGNSAITYADLLGLEHSVDPAYRRRGASWVFNDTTFQALKGILDNDGRPLWFPGLAGLAQAAPSTLMGYGYTIDQDSPDIAATATPIAFGYMPGYFIRIVRGFTLNRFVERYAEFRQLGMSAHMRTDAALIEVDAVKKLTMAV